MKLKIYNFDGDYLTLDGVRDEIRKVLTNETSLIVEHTDFRNTYFPLVHIKCYEIIEDDAEIKESTKQEVIDTLAELHEVRGVPEIAQGILDTEGSAPDLVRLAKGYFEAVDEAKEASQVMYQTFHDEPMSNGYYYHIPFCNGIGNIPIGTEGKLCNCKNLPLFKRLRQQAEKAIAGRTVKLDSYGDANE